MHGWLYESLTTYHTTMFNLQLHHLHQHKTSSLPLLPRRNNPPTVIDDRGAPNKNHNPFLSHNTLSFPIKRHDSFSSRWNIGKPIGKIKSVARETSAASTIKVIRLKAVITVQLTVGGALSNLLTNALDSVTDMLRKSLLLELVAAEIDPSKCAEPVC